MVLQLSVPALSWICTKYIHRYILSEAMKRGEKQTEGMNKKYPTENLSASPDISTVLSNSLATDKLTRQVLTTTDYCGKEGKKKKPLKILQSICLISIKIHPHPYLLNQRIYSFIRVPLLTLFLL